jgi:hypothetical protein
MIQQYQRDGRLIGDRRQDWRGAVQFVNDQRALGEPVVAAYVRSGLLEADQLREPHHILLEEYCVAPVYSLYRIAAKAFPLPNTDAGRLDEVTRRRLAQLDGVAFLFNGRRSDRVSFESDLRDQLAALGSGHHVTQRREFGEILVLFVSRRRPAP